MRHDDSSASGSSVLVLNKKSGRLPVAQRVILVVAYVLFIAVNVSSQAGFFNMPTNAEISDKYTTPITPVGWTFSIWGVIFALQAGGVLYACFGPGGDFGTAMALGRVSVWWILAWTTSCTWQFIFIAQTRAGMIAASVALVATAAFSHRASIIAKSSSRNTIVQTIFVALPSSIYAGWTTIASAIGILVVAVAFDASDAVKVGLSFGVLSLVMLITLLQLFGTKDELFALPIIWGLSGLAAGTPEDSIRIFAIVAASCAALSAIIRIGIDARSGRLTSSKASARTVIVSDTITTNSAKEPFIVVSA